MIRPLQSAEIVFDWGDKLEQGNALAHTLLAHEFASDIGLEAATTLADKLYPVYREGVIEHYQRCINLDNLRYTSGTKRSEATVIEWECTGYEIRAWVYFHYPELFSPNSLTPDLDATETLSVQAAPRIDTLMLSDDALAFLKTLQDEVEHTITPNPFEDNPPPEGC